MTLDQWLKRTGTTEEALAVALRKYAGNRTHQATINRIRHGKRRASLLLAMAIERETGGEVKAIHLPLAPSSRCALLAWPRRGRRART